MSRILIDQYYRNLETRISFGGSRNENSVRFAFATLLNAYCNPKNFIVAEEITVKTSLGNFIRFDGVVKDAFRLDWGYWEAKKETVDLDKEIEAKIKKGYPTDNILFEDTNIAILIQNGAEILRVNMKNPDALDKIINQFLAYERAEIKDFRLAIKTFSDDLPTILDTLRKLINEQSINNNKFIIARDKFLKVCQESINPNIGMEDIREMIIQHILTEDIFLNIFNDAQFHQENNIASQVNEVIKTFFTGSVKKQTFKTIESYYRTIINTASNIVNHKEKQDFLKIVYEEFYKAYNPKMADRLGIVYTPNEIVKFMVESTDFLLDKHFNKSLGDKSIEILDPATGTGTFITEILDYLLTKDISYKYLNEIHCNEVSILPYYIANLNIEYTYQQKTGEYLEFNNICLVDSLEHTDKGEKQLDFLTMNQENTERIKRQNDRKISVIIGNPPYNANQQNENDNNKNREYSEIDKRIKETYIKESTAQKTKLYDMYSRFYRWASDRIDEDGIIAFITNSSFIDARTFDGFRKCLEQDFSYIYIVDLGGNVRAISGKDGIFISEKHTIFGKSAMIGIAICFLVKDSKVKTSNIYYSHPFHIHELRDKKIEYINTQKFQYIPFERINPDKNHNWINLTDNDFDGLIPLANKETKLAQNNNDEQAIFKLFSTGISTNRDEWIIDKSKDNLSEKMKLFIDIYNSCRNFNDKIKWSRNLKQRHQKGLKEVFLQSNIKFFCYRPFSPSLIYDSLILIDERGYTKQLSQEKLTIAISAKSANNPFQCLVSDKLIDLHLTGDSQCFPLYRDENGKKIDNITDWGLQQFREYYTSPPQPPSPKGEEGERFSPRYGYNDEDLMLYSLKGEEGESFSSDSNSPLSLGEGLGVRAITKIDIFYYVYAVLHNPKYREKYELNLKRDFPRIPFYDDFYKWVNWGKQLMDLHLNYETIKPYELKRVDIQKPGFSEKPSLSPLPKPKLKADKTNNKIIIDEVTTLENIPKIAWEYKLGNRSALEWILDQYKEKKPKDKTIAEKFNNYKFANYKEQVIDLLMRVTTVSVETMKIIKEMK